MYGEDCVPCSPGSSENELVYPSIHAEDRQAEMLGVEDMNVGDEFEVKVAFRVQRISKSQTEGGKKSLSVSLDMIAMDGEIEADEVADETDVEEAKSSGIMLILGK
jgi:hypothetical protein